MQYLKKAPKAVILLLCVFHVRFQTGKGNEDENPHFFEYTKQSKLKSIFHRQICTYIFPYAKNLFSRAGIVCIYFTYIRRT